MRHLGVDRPKFEHVEDGAHGSGASRERARVREAGEAFRRAWAGATAAGAVARLADAVFVHVIAFGRALQHASSMQQIGIRADWIARRAHAARTSTARQASRITWKACHRGGVGIIALRGAILRASPLQHEPIDARARALHALRRLAHNAAAAARVASRLLAAGAVTAFARDGRLPAVVAHARALGTHAVRAAADVAARVDGVDLQLEGEGTPTRYSTILLQASAPAARLRHRPWDAHPMRRDHEVGGQVAHEIMLVLLRTRESKPSARQSTERQSAEHAAMVSVWWRRRTKNSSVVTSSPIDKTMRGI